MNEGIVSINGELSPLNEAKISVTDRGFLFGDGIFEVIVGFHGKILSLSEHLDRLYFSAKSIGFDLPWTKSDLEEEVYEVYKKTSFPKTYIRLAVTRGQGFGLQPHNVSYTKLIYVLRAPKIQESAYTKGLSLKTEENMSTSRGPEIKKAYYLPGIVKMIEMAKGVFDDILWVNSDGELTEATTANIFFVGREGGNVSVYTPQVENGLLNGITRSSILSLLRSDGFDVHETTILKDEIPRFDEAFITSTIKGIVPISKIDEKAFETLRPSAMFHRIRDLHLNWVYEQVSSVCDWNTGEKIIKP